MVFSRISVNVSLFCTQWFTITIGKFLSFHTIKFRTQQISLTIKLTGFFIGVDQIKISVQSRFVLQTTVFYI